MKVHLVDGTYELFRSHFGVPPASAPDGRPVGAVRGLIQTLLALLRQDDVTHVACAFDHVVESFRNEMFSGYKTGEGVPDDLMGQFSLAEEAAAALGLVVWPMIEFEADDVIATAVSLWRDRADVEQIVICSPEGVVTADDSRSLGHPHPVARVPVHGVRRPCVTGCIDRIVLEDIRIVQTLQTFWISLMPFHPM